MNHVSILLTYVALCVKFYCTTKYVAICKHLEQFPPPPRGIELTTGESEYYLYLTFISYFFHCNVTQDELFIIGMFKLFLYILTIFGHSLYSALKQWSTLKKEHILTCQL